MTPFFKAYFISSVCIAKVRSKQDVITTRTNGTVAQGKKLSPDF